MPPSPVRRRLAMGAAVASHPSIPSGMSNAEASRSSSSPFSSSLPPEPCAETSLALAPFHERWIFSATLTFQISGLEGSNRAIIPSFPLIATHRTCLYSDFRDGMLLEITIIDRFHPGDSRAHQSCRACRTMDQTVNKLVDRSEALSLRLAKCSGIDYEHPVHGVPSGTYRTEDGRIVDRFAFKAGC